MKLDTRPILALAFGVLIALTAASGLSALQRAQRIFGEISSLHRRYQEGERILNEVRTEIHLSGVLVRDFLLDRSNLTADTYREQLRTIRASIPKEIEQLKAVFGPHEAEKLTQLGKELDGYWDSLDPLFTWTPGQILAFGSVFLRRQVLPRRNAVLDIAREIRDLNQANLERQRKEVELKERELPGYIGRMLAVTLLLGLLVAGASIYRITRLERNTEVERERAEAAERELRRLSQQLVRAHEEERRAISRELHDEVGQMLTAQRMELRNLRALRNAPEVEFMAHLEASAQLSEETLRVVRGLAMGLRPSMLDDLGLGPAVEWQAREFSRRYGVPVVVNLEGPLDQLSDAHRTCVYRVVQEALTNCARHAHAKKIRVAVHGQEDRLSITIQDDGAGFNAANSRGRGLGLIGIEERVKELGGKLSIISQPGKGTVLAAEIPLTQKEAAPV
jgi:signal transduction histidine kinase